jgi:hypothetical protein
VSDAFLFLRSLTDFSGEIVLADSELFVYVNQFLAGVLQEESAGQEEKRSKQIGEEHESIQANGPSVVVKNYLPVRNQEFKAVHQEKAEDHEEDQSEK